jgi:hypothetical protein
MFGRVEPRPIAEGRFQPVGLNHALAQQGGIEYEIAQPPGVPLDGLQDFGGKVFISQRLLLEVLRAKKHRVAP